jgi:hypothetical protein
MPAWLGSGQGTWPVHDPFLIDECLSPDLQLLPDPSYYQNVKTACWRQRVEHVNTGSEFSVSQKTAKAQRRPRIDSDRGFFWVCRR